MQAKYVLGLLLVLQVSLSLCQTPTPSADLVQKYMALKDKFQRRITKLIEKIQESSGIELPKAVTNAEVFVKALDADIQPKLEQARLRVLKMYEDYLRPYIGKPLDDGIYIVQPLLDSFAPSE